MRGLLIFILITVVSCQTSDIHEKSMENKPDWVNQILIDTNNESATIDRKEINHFDETVFKFKSVQVSEPVKEEKKKDGGAAINLVINNGSGGDDSAKAAPVNLSRIERMYNSSLGLSGGKFVRQAGYSELSNETPGKDSPVSPDYKLGPGDKVKVSITGSLSIDKTFTLDDKGSLFLPERIGEVPLFGVMKSNLEEAVASVVSKEFKNFKLSATLVDLRNIRILVSGKANSPGIKNLLPGSTLLDALAKSGGVSKEGSLRTIVIKKRNQGDQVVDLYELFFMGRKNLDLPLDHGDQIIIPPIGKTVCLIGMAGQGIYEIGGETLQQMLKVHGKVNAFTSRDRVFLERTHRQKQREVLSLSLEQALPLLLEDGFVVEFQGVRNELDNTVELAGEIARPGIYPWKEGMKVSDLLKKGEGFLLNASMHLALLKRRLNGEAIYKNSGDTSILRVREEIIWIPIDRILENDDVADLRLKRFDTLQVLSMNDLQDTPQVEILGAVRKSGKYNLTQNLTLGDLVRLAGNTSREAYPGNGVIVRKVYNNTARSFDVKMYHFNVKEVLTGGKSSLVTLEDGDRVIVRQAASGSVRVNISGQVRFPGSYILPEGSKITDLLIAAGGILESADLRAANFTRNTVLDLQRERMNEMFVETRQRYSRNRSYITRDGRLKESYASTMELDDLDELKNEMSKDQVKGRIVLNFLQGEFPGSSDNLSLEDGDTLRIPKLLNSVLVMGHVYSPNAFIWKTQMSVGEYLKLSGGYKEEAGEEEVYLVMANGVVKSAKQVGHGELMSFVPGPGDTILVPRKEMDRSSMAVASDYLNILRQAAELGAVANSINSAQPAQIGINSDHSTENVTRGSYRELLNRGGK